MTFKDFLELADASGTLILAGIAFLVWRIKMNDLPHIHEAIVKLGERVASLEGIKAGIELERLRRK